jgi:hypothetical protein
VKRLVGILEAPAFWLGAVAFLIAVFLYEKDADGAFAIWDGLWYGHYAELRPAQSILPHHPLFHLIVAGLTKCLASQGFDGPGHLAIRIVAGLGAALVIWLVAALCGPGRPWVGFAFALVLFSTRAFIAEAATGENLLPGFAAALVLFQCATGDRPSVVKLGVATVFALCLRQDNLLLLPAALMVAAPKLEPGRRLRPLLGMLAVCGVIVLAFYFSAWLWVRTEVPKGFFEYLTRFGHTARYVGPSDVDIRVSLHLGAFAAALVGRQWFEPGPHILLGGAFLALLAIATLLLRGRAPSARYAAAVLVTLAIRFPFYAWFEPDNFEWQILPIVLLVALGARTANGEPATSIVARRAGIALLVVIASTLLAFHAGNTLALRQRRLATAVSMAIEAGGPRAFFLPLDKSAMIAVELRLREYEQKDVPYGDPLTSMAQRALELRAKLNRPIVAISDRFVETGMPYDLAHAGEGRAAFDAHKESKEFRVIEFEGKKFAAVFPKP